MLTHEEAARLLGMKTSEVVGVQTTGDNDDTVITLHDRSRVRVPHSDAGVESWEFLPPAASVEDPAVAATGALPADWRDRLRDWWDTGADAEAVVALIESWSADAEPLEAQPVDAEPVDVQPVEEDTDDDPPPVEDTAAGVLDWVAGDPARAARAREAEQARERPRSSLLTQLDKLAAAEPTE